MVSKCLDRLGKCRTVWDADMYEVLRTIIWGHKEQMYKNRIVPSFSALQCFGSERGTKKWDISPFFKSKQHLSILKAKVGGIYLNEKGEH